MAKSRKPAKRRVAIPKMGKYATAAQVNQVNKKIDRLHKIISKQSVKASAPRVKRKPSAYNKFAKKMLKGGSSFADVAKAWKKKNQ